MTDWFHSAAELLNEPDPGETPFLIDDLITDQSVAQLVGAPKLGKTYVLLDSAVAVATGGKALGRFNVRQPGPVLLVLEESGRAALHRRESSQSPRRLSWTRSSTPTGARTSTCR